MERDEKDNRDYKQRRFFFYLRKGNLNLGLKFHCSIWEFEFEIKFSLVVDVRNLAVVVGKNFSQIDKARSPWYDGPAPILGLPTFVPTVVSRRSSGSAKLFGWELDTVTAR